jgi:tetratricopeptide (TPR) repeat protein
MKSKYVLLVSSVLISVSTFAQKDQIKAAEKALKNGDPMEANTSLQQAESLMSNATEAEKAQFFLVKGNVYYELVKRNTDVQNSQLQAAKAYQEMLATEKKSGKSKYTDQAQEAITVLKSNLVTAAIENGNKKNYSFAAKELKSVYDLDTKDVEKLYYAASYAINGQEYDEALDFYSELIKLNYSGEGMNYYAKNSLTDNEDYFGNTKEAKGDRDNKVKLKVYSAPRDEKIPSRRGEIYKNVAFVYIQKGKIEEAKKAITEAKALNPEDSSLLLTEANLYLDAKDFVTYKKLISEILEKNPTNAELFYNLGVITYNNNELVDSEKYYLKAIEIDPAYTNAYLNLAILKLDADKPLIEKIKKLGNSKEDNAKYTILRKQQIDVYTGAMPFLEKAVALDAKNLEAAKTLLNVYNALEMMDKAKPLKAKVKEMEGK